MGTISGGAAKLNRKKSTMTANFRFDTEAFVEGLRAAGLSSVRASRVSAYSSAEADAKTAYQQKLGAIDLGGKWQANFVKAMS